MIALSLASVSCKELNETVGSSGDGEKVCVATHNYQLERRIAQQDANNKWSGNSKNDRYKYKGKRNL